MQRRPVGILFLWMTLHAWPAIADDLADEADLQFDLGTQSYHRADYRTALEHFLASNRLVPNANVVFNVARAYERLGQYPEAYRAYASALSLESKGDARVSIQRELDRIRPQVVLLNCLLYTSYAADEEDSVDLGGRRIIKKK